MEPETHELDLVRPSNWETALEKIKQIKEERKQSALRKKEKDKQSANEQRSSDALQTIKNSQQKLFESYFGIDLEDSKQVSRFSREELAELMQKLTLKIRPWAYLQVATLGGLALTAIAIPIYTGSLGFNAGGTLLTHALFAAIWAAIGLIADVITILPLIINLDPRFNSKEFYLAYQFLKKHKTEKELKKLIFPT